jgi:DNA-binding response OmpR family regulator
MVQLLTRISQHRGFQVLQAHDGDHAIRQALKHPVDLVILDLKMPGTSGFEVVTKLKEHRKTQDVPILIHTGINLSDDDKKNAFSSNSTTFSAGNPPAPPDLEGAGLTRSPSKIP